MTADQLRKSILQQAMQGKLVPQDPKDEPASVLLERIREEKARLIKEKKAKREKNPSRIFRGEDNSYYEEFTATGEVRCIDDEIPFDIPDSWRWAKIKMLYQTSSGGTPDRGHPEYYGGDILWVKVGDLVSMYIDVTEETISKRGLECSSAKVFPRGTILVAMYCNDAIGRAGIISKPMATNQAICGLYANELLSAGYIYYAILANNDVLQEQSAGGAQKNINQKIINDLLLPLPPLAEQERIVAKIEELMPWVEQYGKAQSELDQLNNSIQGRLRKSILQYTIEGKLVPQQAEDGSAEELLAEIQAEKQRLYAAGKLKKKDLAHSTIFRAEDGKYYEQVGKTITCIDEEIPFDLPDGWVWTRLGEIAVSMADGPFGSNLKVEHYTHDPEVRIIQLSNIGEYGWRDSNKRYTTYEHLLSIERSVVDPGDIVIAKMMPAGRAIICPDMDNKYVLSSDAVKLKPASGLDVNFLLFAINSEIFRGQVYSDVQGITRVRTSISKLKGYLVPLPPLAEQQRIVTKLEEVFGVMDRLGQ